MSRTFQDSVAYDVANTFLNENEFGSHVTYQVSGESTSLVAIVKKEQQVEEEFDNGRRLHVFRDVTISRNPDDACGGIANPRTDATVTIGEVVYAVESIPYQDDHTSTLRLVRKESLEHGRRNYRGI